MYRLWDKDDEDISFGLVWVFNVTGPVKHKIESPEQFRHIGERIGLHTPIVVVCKKKKLQSTKPKNFYIYKKDNINVTDPAQMHGYNDH